jgi:hypothetical protein
MMFAPTHHGGQRITASDDINYSDDQLAMLSLLLVQRCVRAYAPVCSCRLLNCVMMFPQFVAPPPRHLTSRGAAVQGTPPARSETHALSWSVRPTTCFRL